MDKNGISKSGEDLSQMEKSGTIVLTETDLESFEQGIVSDRLKEEWNLSLEELSDIIQKKNYTINKD